MILALILSLAPAEALHSLVDRDWAWRMAEFPQYATQCGAHEADDRLGRVDEESHRRRLRDLEKRAAELSAIDRAQLSQADRVDAAVLAEILHSEIADLNLRAYLVPMKGDENFFAGVAHVYRGHIFRNAADYEKYVKRLRDIPRYFDENIALMREGLRSGITAPQIVVRGKDETAKVIATATPRASPFFKPFLTLPPGLARGDEARLRELGEAAIREAVQPAYAKVAKFLRDEYLPGARKTIAASDLPNGAAWYRAQIREYVTEEMEPQAIHDLGQREVQRIRAEMEKVKAEVGFQGDLTAFLKMLRTDPRFYAKTPEELLMRAALIAKTIDGMLPHYFGLLPRLPYRVEAVPAEIAPYYTGGRYVGAAQGSDEPGTYWVNTYDLPSRPLYVLPSLTLHEAVPGHHLQIALAAEHKDAPPFRRFTYFSVYGEGWGLYAEKLGEEMGIYKTPYERFGRMTYEMWRACRLVVDTGMHALGWPREKAIAFMRDNTALSVHEIETEIDRYIGWPGQALSYKIGELAIRELRAKAERDLGPRFELKKFHDAILALGAVPLPVLREEVTRALQ
jgi:uncharacterized protein (DUF885 family)